MSVTLSIIVLGRAASQASNGQRRSVGDFLTDSRSDFLGWEERISSGVKIRFLRCSLRICGCQLDRLPAEWRAGRFYVWQPDRRLWIMQPVNRFFSLVLNRIAISVAVIIIIIIIIIIIS
jgi:hypothetical protein